MKDANRKITVVKYSYRYEMGDEINDLGVLTQRARRINTFEGSWSSSKECNDTAATLEGEVKH